MSIQFRRSTIEDGVEEIYDNTVHGLTASIGGGKSDQYKIVVSVKAVGRELTRDLTRRFEPLLRSIQREMKSDPVGLNLNGDEVTDEETGEINEIPKTQKVRKVKRATALNRASRA